MIFLRSNSNRARAVAISVFMEKSLRRSGVPFCFRAVFPPKSRLASSCQKRKRSLLLWLPHEVYHNDVVMKYIEPKFIYTGNLGSEEISRKFLPPFKYFSHAQMTETYKECFLLIRLTLHDGLAGCVQEAGMMGIRSVWNGNTPSSIPWNSLDDIADAIRLERLTVGRTNVSVSEQVRSFLQPRPEYFLLSHYFGFTTQLPDVNKILVLAVPKKRMKEHSQKLLLLTFSMNEIPITSCTSCTNEV